MIISRLKNLSTKKYLDISISTHIITGVKIGDNL